MVRNIELKSNATFLTFNHLENVKIQDLLSVRNWDFFSLARGTVALYNLM